MEENNNGELTFKMIGEKLRESGVRMIVYCLVAVIVVGGILGICDIFVSQSQYETSITYYYPGVENGKDPWGGNEDVISDIKSASNVSSALRSLEYSDEEVDALVGLIIRNLNIISSVSNEVATEDGTTVSANYNFRIVLSQNQQIDKYLKSRNDYNNILSAITTTHIENFKKKYSIGTSVTKLETVDSYNYFRKYSAINTYINLAKEEISIWQKMAPDFISTSQNINFATLNARVDAVAFKADSYLNFILFNGIDANSESEYIAMQIRSAEDLISIYDSEIAKQNEVLETLMQNSDSNVSGGGGAIIINPPNEQVLKIAVDAIARAIENKSLAQAEKNTWLGYESYFDKSGYSALSAEEKLELQNSAKVLEEQMIKEVNNLVDVYTTMIEEYNNGYNVSSLVRVASIPKQTINSPITMKIGLIIEIMTIVLAAIVAMLVTNKKGKLILKRKKEFQSQAEMVLIENNQGDVKCDSESDAIASEQGAIAQTQEIEGVVEEQPSNDGGLEN